MILIDDIFPIYDISRVGKWASATPISVKDIIDRARTFHVTFLSA